MDDWLRLVLAILTCYRLTQLITLDDGPASIFDRLRLWAGAYDYEPSGKAKTRLGQVITCPYCIGIWIALPVALCAIGIGWYTLIWWLAIAGGQSFLQALADRQ